MFGVDDHEDPRLMCRPPCRFWLVVEMVSSIDCDVCDSHVGMVLGESANRLWKTGHNWSLRSHWPEPRYPVVLQPLPPSQERGQHGHDQHGRAFSTGGTPCHRDDILIVDDVDDDRHRSNHLGRKKNNNHHPNPGDARTLVVYDLTSVVTMWTHGHSHQHHKSSAAPVRGPGYQILFVMEEGLGPAVPLVPSEDRNPLPRSCSMDAFLGVRVPGLDCAAVGPPNPFQTLPQAWCMNMHCTRRYRRLS